jgi:protoheme IX farnesyltransferase
MLAAALLRSGARRVACVAVAMPPRASPLAPALLLRRHAATVSSSAPSAAAAAAPAAAGAGAAAPPPAASPSRSLLSAYLELSKARLSALVVFTSGAGYLMAGPFGGAADGVASASAGGLLAAVTGTALAAASAGALNQLIEKPLDARMKRTASRPLPSGRLTPAAAAGFAAGAAAASAAVLLAGTNALTAALGMATIAAYAFVYTPLKTRSACGGGACELASMRSFTAAFTDSHLARPPAGLWNTAVGAVVGAVPPLMGWAAATGGALAFEPMLLGAALAAWQLPHFYALAWGLRADYARGGFVMAPVLDATGGKRTAWLALRGALALAALPPLAALLGVTSAMFAVEGVALNAVFLRLAARFYAAPSDAAARALFRASLWYLPLLLALMVFHSRHWHAPPAAAPAAAADAAAAAAGADAGAAAAPPHAGARAPAAEPRNARDLAELAQRGMARLHAAGRAACLHEIVVRREWEEAAAAAAGDFGRSACRALFQRMGAMDKEARPVAAPVGALGADADAPAAAAGAAAAGAAPAIASLAAACPVPGAAANALR